MDHVSKETGRLLISIRTPQTRICVIPFRSDAQRDVIVTLRQAAVPFPSIVENVEASLAEICVLLLNSQETVRQIYKRSQTYSGVTLRLYDPCKCTELALSVWLIKRTMASRPLSM
jgi:hypothetical protein